MLLMGDVGGQIPHHSGNQRMFPTTGASLIDAKCHLLKMNSVELSSWGELFILPSHGHRGTETETEPSPK